jgi:hypothetical protein
MLFFQPRMPARMSCSISDARRSADFRSAKPVDTTNRWPLIIFLKYQVSPRFIKPIAHPLCHPAIQRETVETDDASLPDERDLAAPDALIQRMDAHAQVPGRAGHVEPARLEYGVLLLSLFQLHDQAPQPFRVVAKSGAASAHGLRIDGPRVLREHDLRANRSS